MAKTLIFVEVEFDFIIITLTVLSSYCLLISKILTLVIQLGFEKQAFEMSSFQSPSRSLVTIFIIFP